MDDGAINTLMLPIVTGEVETGGLDAHWLFLNAVAPPIDCPFEKTQITAVQGFRPAYLALQKADWNPTATVPEGEDSYDGALVLVSRHRGETRRLINLALDKVKTGGLIVVAGSKNDGIASVAKEIGVGHDIVGNQSKYHAKVFWFENRSNARLEETISSLVDNRFETAPGMFSSDHIDPGSALLIAHLPKETNGRIADFCAGWGYLSAEAAKVCPSIKSIALYEADFASLEAAKLNMKKIAPDTEATYHWQDLIAEKASGDYDTIIMNPPFHQGRAADPAIGIAIIRNAHNALHRGGKLFLVANRALPYEEILAASFFKSGELARNAYYKVLWAQK